jgi:hypothetical protein
MVADLQLLPRFRLGLNGFESRKRLDSFMKGRYGSSLVAACALYYTLSNTSCLSEGVKVKKHKMTFTESIHISQVHDISILLYNVRLNIIF